MGFRTAFQFPIYFIPDIFNKVLPFHMAKGMRTMRSIVNNCDCVIEIRDARVPLSSSNKQFGDLFVNKPRIVMINKIDMADEEKTKILSRKISTHKNTTLLFSNCKSQFNDAVKKVLPILKEIFVKRNKEIALKVNKPSQHLHDGEYKVLVCGIPNVGKSSFINSARRHFMAKGGRAAPVGKIPGITRSVMQSILISRSPRILILDTPGIWAPQITDPLIGIKLALTGTFPDHVIGEEVIADYLLYTLNRQKNTSYLDMCGLTEACDDFEHVITSFARKKNLFRNNDPDFRRCSMMLIAAFRNGKLGAVTLDDI